MYGSIVKFVPRWILNCVRLSACLPATWIVFSGQDILGQATRAEYERALAAPREANKWAGRINIQPHWSGDGNSVWYKRTQPGGVVQHVTVNALTGERRVSDAPGITQDGALAPARETTLVKSPGSGLDTELLFENTTGAQVTVFWMNFVGEKVRYFDLQPGEKRSLHTYANHVWRAETTAGKMLGVWQAPAVHGIVTITGEARVNRDSGLSKEAAVKNPGASPQWTPFIREHNIWLKNAATAEEVQLSREGREGDPFVSVYASPDGTRVAAIQIRKAQERLMHLVESAPKDQLQPRLHVKKYRKPGDEIDRPRVRLFETVQRTEIPVGDELFRNPWSIERLRWAPDGRHFFFLYNERGHQVQRVLAVNAGSGKVRAIVEEVSATFIDYSQKTFMHWLDATGELVWASERDGWNHLWLVDTETGAVKNQITSGPWVVRGVEEVDALSREIWFRCSGIYPGQDPYYVHLARVGLDGSGLIFLTSSDGTHALRENGEGGRRLWELSPDKRFIIVSHSRVDLPPVAELRRTSDGSRVCVLEEMDCSPLQSSGWRAPERFQAKGRDGQTDIFGVILRPSHFDPQKKYPVIENIYAGPHGYFVPKEWNPGSSARALAELGFILVQIDGMGTNWRSRAFHDVAWKNLKDAGFPDRIAWIRAAAARYPEMDLTRVGIYGGSAGGQNALAALLHHGDFYHAAVADCGCHDNRMDKVWWNEAWMGWPVGPEYAESSNVVHASKLRGKLLLTVGELDENVDPASTHQVVRALIEADKDFELLVLPGVGHGAGEKPYAFRRRMAFFVRHLLGVEPRW
jgi:dipeptidyl aminopeptidase/acylaminoacyl peptidase